MQVGNKDGSHRENVKTPRSCGWWLWLYCETLALGPPASHSAVRTLFCRPRHVHVPVHRLSQYQFTRGRPALGAHAHSKEVLDILAIYLEELHADIVAAEGLRDRPLVDGFEHLLDHTRNNASGVRRAAIGRQAHCVGLAAAGLAVSQYGCIESKSRNL